MLSLCTRTAHNNGTGDTTNSTVGIQLDGTTIELVEFGGPAFFSGMCVGDAVVAIDDVEVTESNVRDMLVGCDRPGTCVKIEYCKGSSDERLTAKLMRISIEEMKTRSAIFESLQEKTLVTHDKEGLCVLDHDLVNAILESIQKLSTGSPGRSPDSFVSPRHTYINSQFLRCSSLPHEYSIPVMEKLHRSQSSWTAPIQPAEAGAGAGAFGAGAAEGSPQKFSILSRFQSNLQLGFARQITETNSWKSPKPYNYRDHADMSTIPSSDSNTECNESHERESSQGDGSWSSSIRVCEELTMKIERDVEQVLADLSHLRNERNLGADNFRSSDDDSDKSNSLLGCSIPDINGTVVGYKFEHFPLQHDSEPARRQLVAEDKAGRRCEGEVTDARTSTAAEKSSSSRDEALVTRVIKHYQKNHEEIAELLALRKMKTFLEDKVSKLNESLNKSKRENSEASSRLDQLKKEARDLRKKLNASKSELSQVKEDHMKLKDLYSSKERDILAMEAKSYIMKSSGEIKAKNMSTEMKHMKNNIEAMSLICNELKEGFQQANERMLLLEQEMQGEKERAKLLLEEVKSKELQVSDLKQNLIYCESSNSSSAHEARQAFHWIQRKLHAAREEINELSSTCQELRETSRRLQHEQLCGRNAQESERRRIFQQMQAIVREIEELTSLAADSSSESRRQEANELKVAQRLMKLAEDMERMDVKLKDVAKLQVLVQDLLTSKDGQIERLVQTMLEAQQQLEAQRVQHASELEDREEEVKSVRSKLQSITQDMTQSMAQSRLILNKCDEDRRAALREVAALKNENAMLHHELEAKILDNIASHRRHQQLVSYFTSQVARVEADTLQLESLTKTPTDSQQEQEEGREGD
ncbi:hypothetical protein GUITHDRAFT_144101 [Guillardia theta CCMP2712]|uniref:PDZ domain-containing protein n=1 Tax=Guillardia theta (strain CCMP2712) TaxID=905079 RepID=L1IS37_GUITC|nr:hypothetical protein GUITHDRAFT_144101 [Guillardia theta CCMP2712]EKX38714.1 hypothetical protein GUITHDRAFT_144101 [Guillardia theta CCMP2712]|eukprot:XP_005825694.1 hypothetical protein GUITHDRAFT_144101 [Guillardia theta CCMP2712]